MNKNIFKGKWKKLKGSVKGKRGKITDNDIVEVKSNPEKLVVVLQKKYDYSQDQEQQDYRKFMEDIMI